MLWTSPSEVKPEPQTCTLLDIINYRSCSMCIVFQHFYNPLSTSVIINRWAESGPRLGSTNMLDRNVIFLFNLIKCLSRTILSLRLIQLVTPGLGYGVCMFYYKVFVCKGKKCFRFLLQNKIFRFITIMLLRENKTWC